MVKWIEFTRRTEDPKLAWLQCRLKLAGIPSRRKGFSFHAPLLEVREQDLDAAWAILTPVDNIRDDAPRFRAMKGCPPELTEQFTTAGQRHEMEHMKRLTRRLPHPVGQTIWRKWQRGKR